MREPLLSIIIVSYKTPSLILRRAMQSVLEQSYKNYEIILVDANESGSNYSLGLREDMENHYPDIPVITCESPKGELAAAKNAGAAQANGTYLAFLMAQDAWNQECAANQIEVLEQHPDVALVFCHRWLQEEDALSLRYRSAPEETRQTVQSGKMLSQEAIPSVSQVMFRRTAFEDMLGFDTHIHRQDDYDMWIRLSEKYKIASVDQNLVCSFVERGVLKKSRRNIDVVGYLQLYSKHRDMYRQNPENRLELYQKIAACYKEGENILPWINYSVRIKGLEMRIGKKKVLPAGAVKETVPAYEVLSQQDKEFIAIVKYVTGKDGGTGTPEEGAQFQIYLKTAGDFDRAMANERDILICDHEGYAKSKPLSQGEYVVHQVKGSEGARLAEDFLVTLERTGKTHTFSVNSSREHYLVKVIRKDAETGKIIPVAGGTYRIETEDGAPVIMSVTYPEPVRLEMFSTGEKGFFVTPSSLDYGMYIVKEEKPPYGYVRNEAPVPFVVSGEYAGTENGISLITVETENMAQKMRIQLHKTGPVLPQICTDENPLKNQEGHPVGGNVIYTPHFMEGSAAGAAYEIIAQEDIFTPDGTLRAEKGSVVDVMTTGENGDAVSGELYLGTYQIREKMAAAGLLCSQMSQEIAADYEESQERCVNRSVEFAGERQKAHIHLKKVLGEDKIFGIGKLGEITDVVFGLFAAEPIELAEDTVIPADGLIEILRCDEEGEACSSADLPAGNYYVKELLTNSHYRRSDTRYPVNYSGTDQENREAHLYVNEGEPISSEMIRGTIRGIKTDLRNQPLAMAEIGLFTADTQEFSREQAVLLAVTDWNGAFAFKEIPCGDYVIKEVKAPQGFVLNDAMYFVALTFDGQRVDLKLMGQAVR